MRAEFFFLTRRSGMSGSNLQTFPQLGQEHLTPIFCLGLSTGAFTQQQQVIGGQRAQEATNQ